MISLNHQREPFFLQVVKAAFRDAGFTNIEIELSKFDYTMKFKIRVVGYCPTRQANHLIKGTLAERLVERVMKNVDWVDDTYEFFLSRLKAHIDEPDRVGEGIQITGGVVNGGIRQGVQRLQIRQESERPIQIEAVRLGSITN